MKVLINYANDKYKKTQKVNTWTGKYVGKIDETYSFNPSDIESTFYNENKKTLDNQRGNGLWLWKPYFILKVMKKREEGDIIIYSDSGSFFLRNVDKLIETMGEKKIWVSDIPLLEDNFTKPFCFKEMNCENDIYKSTNQIQATFFMAINCKETRIFVEKWLDLCCKPDLLSPEKAEVTKCSSGINFIEHREDQSILSLLCKKEGILPHLDPTHRGKYPKWYENDRYKFLETNHNDKYPPILFLHKTPDVNIISCLRQFLICLKTKYSILEKLDDYRKTILRF